MLKLLFLSLGLIFASETQTPSKPILEISFGRALVYASSKERRDFIESYNAAIPTNSALFLGEWFTHPKIRLISFLNLPLQPEQHLDSNGVLTLKKAYPYAGVGPNFSPWNWNVLDRFSIELQTAILGGVVLYKLENATPVLILAERVLLSTAEGTTMYIGVSYTLNIAAATLLYGIGHRF